MKSKSHGIREIDFSGCKLCNFTGKGYVVTYNRANFREETKEVPCWHCQDEVEVTLEIEKG